MNSIKHILINRDKLTPEEADYRIEDALAHLVDELEKGKPAENLCRNFFNLPQAYVVELLNKIYFVTTVNHLKH